MAPQQHRSGWINVLNQAPMASATGIYPLNQMLASRPSPMFYDGPGVQVGDAAPPFSLERSDGGRLSFAELEGKPVLLRLTRAVTGRVI